MGVEWMFPPHTGRHVRQDPPLVPQPRKAEPSALRRLIRGAFAAGTAEAGDLPGITAGGDAGTEDETKSVTGYKT
jgi:hypothetical protein